jgi:hypothetical protein
MKNQMKAPTEFENHLCLVPAKEIENTDITLINPKKQPLSLAVLRTFKGFEEISDEEGESICKHSLLIAQMLLEYIGHINCILIDNQQVVHSTEQNETLVINFKTPYKNIAA